jgi:acetyl esterase/lipase
MIDVLSSYKYLLYNDDGTPRYKPSQISFVGDSAGGGLAIACALYLRDTGLFPMPGAIGCFSPWVNSD